MEVCSVTAENLVSDMRDYGNDAYLSYASVNQH